MEEEQQEGQSSSKRFIILAVVAVIILAVGFTFMFLRGDQDETNTNTETNSATVTDTNSTVTDNTNVVASTSPVAQARDADRVNDIRALRIALTSHYTDNDQYPETLDGLINGGYLATLPTNPEPGGKSYSYTPIGSDPFMAYDLCYTLESNAIEGIGAGDHCANQDGITGFF